MLCQGYLKFTTMVACVLSQIYVEVPRARLTMELAKIMESRNETAKAANILQELQVISYIIIGLFVVVLKR